MYQSILVPIDGSEYAHKAFEVACKLATPSHATIYLLHVPELPEAEDALGKAVGASDLEASEEEAKQSGLELLNKIKTAEEAGHNLIERAKSAVGLVDVELQPVVKMGNPAEVIVNEAARLGVEAIVMGSRGISDLQGLVIGSVSHKAMHTAECTVITVH